MRLSIIEFMIYSSDCKRYGKTDYISTSKVYHLKTGDTFDEHARDMILDLYAENNSKYEVTIKTEDENYYRSDIIKLHIPSMDNITSVNIDGDVSCIICETVLLSMMRFGTHKLYCPDTDESMLNDIISSLMFKRLTRATRRLTTEQCPITYNLIGEKEFYYKCLSCNNEFEQLPSINGHFDIQNQTPNVLYAQIC